jgi:hypothetical protein
VTYRPAPRRHRRQTGLVGDFDVGLRADGHQHGVGGNARFVAEPQAGGLAVGGGNLLNLGVQPQVDAVIAVQRGEYGANLFADRAHQRQPGGFDHGDVDVALTRAGGDFQADPARADHSKRRPFGQS